jgi:hypothetical protein
VANFYVTTIGDKVYLQCGWIDGDGNTWCFDWSWLIPEQPTSYREYRGTTTYDFDCYYPQAPNTARQYVVANDGADDSSYWSAKIQGVSRGSYNCLCAKTTVEALSEVVDDNNPSPNEDSATFTSVYYRGRSTYFLFDQNWYEPSLGWFTTTHAPGVYHTYSTNAN